MVELGPVIELNPTQLTPTSFLGDPSPDDDTFTITNSGPDVMTYTVAESAGWLDVSPTGGSSTGEADPITVSYDVTGLASGEHETMITVTSPQAGNSPQTVAVTLTIETVGPDGDGDGDVDQMDFGLFQVCYVEADPQPPCDRFDFDDDNDVDTGDYTVFEACLSGAGIPADRTCDD